MIPNPALNTNLRVAARPVAFVDRGEALRIISLRRANRREVKHYVENC